MLQHTCSSQTDIQSPYHFQTDISIDRHTGCHENAPQVGKRVQQNNTHTLSSTYFYHMYVYVFLEMQI
jgi:hypothetical protein